MLYQVIVYVPLPDAEMLKEALFDAGAGKYENYDRCSWESLGIGQHHTIERVDEIKIETICSAECITNVLIALKSAHPYEEPAYGVIELKTLEDF